MEFPQDEALYVAVTDLLGGIITTLSPKVSQGWEGDEFVPMYLLATVGNLIEVIHIELSGMLAEHGVDVRKESLEKAVEIVDSILYLLLQTQVANEEPYNFETQYLYSLGVRTTSNNIRTSYTSGNIMVEFPSQLRADLEHEEVFQIVSTVVTNPFVWGLMDGYEITSQVLSVSFTFINGSEVKLKDLPPERAIIMGLDQGWSSQDFIDTEHAQHDMTRASSIGSNTSDTQGSILHSYNIAPRTTVSSVLGHSREISTQLGIIFQVSPSMEWHYDMPKDPIELSVYMANGYIPDASAYDEMIRFDARWDGMHNNKLDGNYTILLQAQ